METNWIFLQNAFYMSNRIIVERTYKMVVQFMIGKEQTIKRKRGRGRRGKGKNSKDK